MCPHRHPQRCATAAFTLTELLVVIAIIAVLAAITIPVMSRVAESSRNTRCVSNLRQIHNAMSIFAAENRGFLPSVEARTAADRPEGAKANWWAEILPYYSNHTGGSVAQMNAEVLSCPTHANRLQAAGLSEGAARINYGMNWNLGFSHEASLNKKQVRLATIPQPARTIMVSEAAYNVSTPLATLRTGNIRSSATFDGVYIGGTHNGSNNILWVDGHVSAWADVARLAARQSASDPEPVSTYWRPEMN